MMRLGGFLLVVVLAAVSAFGDEPVTATWKMFRRTEHEREIPREIPGDARDVKVKHKWRSGDDFYWLLADLVVPEAINGKPTRGQPVGMRFSCAAGGDVYVGGVLQARYDNDHPALILLSEAAEPGERVRLAVHAYGNLGGEGDNEFGQADWCLPDVQRVREAIHIRIDPAKVVAPMPDGLIGLSQGGGMADYEDATAAKLREGGFKWFRMDNVLTNAVKEVPGGGTTYDFTDLERRVGFMRKVGADPILCVSYMPQPLDAIPDGERHSAPKDYKLWEELCYRAARHLMEKGMPVTWWEVWNETNAGWLKPGPGDTGSAEFVKLYEAALGKPAASHDDVRLLEAYCKLYAASAAGVCRADPKAKIGGPCLASGPYEQSERGHAIRGKVFARGLMMYCHAHGLPLDFISWHEYFHPADVFVDEARVFRKYLDEFPTLRKQVQSFMLTEWSFSWWADRPQDHEMGAAWCADGMIRAILPERIDRPCFFYVKDNDSNLRGSFAMLIRDNVPKPVYHVARMFNGLTGSQVETRGGDEQICAVAAWDARRNRLAVIVTNFEYRYDMRRKVLVEIAPVPAPLREGRWRRALVDPTHSNVWHDRSRAELQVVETGAISGDRLMREMTLLPNSVTMLEVEPASR